MNRFQELKQGNTKANRGEIQAGQKAGERQAGQKAGTEAIVANLHKWVAQRAKAISRTLWIINREDAVSEIVVYFMEKLVARIVDQTTAKAFLEKCIYRKLQDYRRKERKRSRKEKQNDYALDIAPERAERNQCVCPFIVIGVIKDIRRKMQFCVDLRNKSREAIGFLPICDYEKADSEGRIIFQTENDTPCGFLLHGQLLKERKVLVYQAVLAIDARRIEPASRAVAELERKARANGVTEISLRCAADLEANEFWTANGFQPTGMEKGGKAHIGLLIRYRKWLFVPPIFERQIEW